MDKLTTFSSFSAGVTVKTIVNQNNEIKINLSGPALDPILALAQIPFIEFDASVLDCRSLSSDLLAAAARTLRP